MCTIIFRWEPESAEPLLCGANRDEIQGRPSTHWAVRNKGSILCPLDVRGGTWIGVNSRGLFGAIADRDDVPYTHGNYSRGALLTRALSGPSSSHAVEWMVDLKGPYNGFHLILADRNSCHIVNYDGNRISIQNVDPGLHVVSGFGIDTWKVSRCRNIREMLDNGAEMEQILALHKTGHVDDDVCVHRDDDDNRVTISSSVIRADINWNFTVDAIAAPPCSEVQWDQFMMRGT